MRRLRVRWPSAVPHGRLNFAPVFLRADGRRAPDMGWEDVLRRLDHLIRHLGEDHVGMGSNFDGAMVPQGIGDAAGLPDLLAAMRAHGFDAALMRKLCWDSWIATLRRTWGGWFRLGGCPRGRAAAEKFSQENYSSAAKGSRR